MDWWKRLAPAIPLALSAASWAGPYEDCILQNMKGIQAQAAAGAIARACREKTTPKKCRDSVIGRPVLIEWDDPKTGKKAVNFGAPAAEYVLQLKTQCVEECAQAGYWSRTFGECSTD